MRCGAKTVGNATLIAIDGDPVLATDPWLPDTTAYFGSWQLSHEIPARELAEMRAARFVWLSHGHPDHLNAESLEAFRASHILLSDHVGGRIRADLEAQGYTVSTLRDRRWTRLSERVRVYSIADFAQNSILLVDVNGHLFVNLNDAPPRGWARSVRRIIRGYSRSYLLKIFGYGDADMINFYSEEGVHQPIAETPRPLGPDLARAAEFWGTTHVIPFSSLHKYQRADSAWANRFAVPPGAYGEGFRSEQVEFVPVFACVDCESGSIRPIQARERPDRTLAPETFGDSWSDVLEREDRARIEAYFRRKTRLAREIGYVNLRVGGSDFAVVLDKRLDTGISFEVPRTSLMAAIEHRVFDDLLIGNFMKTTLHNTSSLYDPNFNLFVTKIADNGRAERVEDVEAYFRRYRRRALLEFALYEFEQSSLARVRRLLPSGSYTGDLARKLRRVVTA